MDNEDPYDLTKIKVRQDQLLPIFPELSFSKDDIVRQLQVENYYSEELSRMENVFNELFLKVNDPIFRGVENFVESCLGDRMFEDNAIRIHAANLLLDMQTSDHDSTFDTIEKNLKRFKKLHIQRFKFNLRRKRSLLELLETSNQTTQLLLIIEQAETLDTCLAETLVGNLYERLQGGKSPTKNLMILFCVSTKLQNLPFDSMGCFGKIDTIKRDTEIDKLIIKEHLLRGQNITMKLGDKVLDYIYDCYTNCDASIANVKFLINYTLHEHCCVLLQMENYKEIISDKSKLAKNVRNYHDFLCDELYCYYELLRGLKEWPGDVTCLYTELLEHKTLAESLEFYEAIKKGILGLDSEVILKRFKCVKRLASNFRGSPLSVINIIDKYKQKIEASEECDNLSAKLVDEFLAHAETLKNPLNLNLNEVYHIDHNCIMLVTLETSRAQNRFEKLFVNLDPYFGYVCQALLACPAQTSANELWHDVEEGLERLVRKDRETRISNDVVKTKQTPKKKARGTKKVASDDDNENDAQITGLGKSIFLDLIATMEHQHFIKLSRRGGKGLLIKRTFWLR